MTPASALPPQDVSKVFEEFGQVDGSTARRHEGTGLGVPLSKRLVESHGGRMWLESQPGEGTHVLLHPPRVGAGDPGTAPSGDGFRGSRAGLPQGAPGLRAGSAAAADASAATSAATM